MKKKAQVTLFVILGLVIVIVIFAGMYFKYSISSTSSESSISATQAFSLEQTEVLSSIESCLETNLDDSILIVSFNGGYLPAKRNALNYLGLEIPVYNYSESFVTKQTVESSIAFYLEHNFNKCLPPEAELLQGPRISVAISDNDITAKAEASVSMHKFKLNKFMAKTQTKYLKMIYDSKTFFDIARSFNGSVDIFRLYDISSNYSIYYNTTMGYNVFILNWDLSGKKMIMPFAIRPMPSSETFMIELPPPSLEDATKDGSIDESEIVAESFELTPEDTQTITKLLAILP